MDDWYLRLSIIGPKIHSLEDYLLEYTQKWNRIGDICKDFIEQSHQIGIKDKIRITGLDQYKAFILHSNLGMK